MSAVLEAEVAGRLGTLDLALALRCGPGVTALCGPSGAGKTTVLRWLAGLQRLPGRIVLDGEVWQDAGRFVPPHRRRTGFVFQGAGLLPHLSVRANLAYGARRAAGPIDLDGIAALTGIGDLLDRTPTTLSGGEAQRASLARALAGAPRLLLLDEPLSALDGEGRTVLVDRLADVLPELGIPVLLVSHDARDMDALAGRVVRMRAGRIED